MPSLTIEAIQAKVEQMALPLMAEANIDLVELQVGRHGADVFLRFTADRPMGGITIGECARLNRAIVSAIELDGFLGEAFELEFSSPGLDRPLTTAKDFMRNLNRSISFSLKEAVEGKKAYKGILIAVDGEMLTVSLNKKNTIVLPLAQIASGLLVI